MVDTPADPEKAKGYAPGKRVWLRETWDGAILARRLGEYAEHMKIGERGDKPDPYGRLQVILGDGTPYDVRKDLLRLTPPPGLAQKRETAKAAAAKPRKEAIPPDAGEELSLLDLELDGGSIPRVASQTPPESTRRAR